MNDTASNPDLNGEPGWTATGLPSDFGIVSFVSGEPEGERLRVRYYRGPQGGLCGKVWFGPGTQGPPGHAHGGSIASILDEAMGAATWMGGHPAVALELVSRFRNMIPLGTVATITAEISETEGRKVRTVGRLEGSDGTLYAEGEGLFLELDPARLGDLAERANKMMGAVIDPPPVEEYALNALDPALRSGLVFPEPASALASMTFVQSGHPAVLDVAKAIGEPGANDRGRAVAAYDYVRNEIGYEFRPKLRPEQYEASTVIREGRGFCVQKAVLLVALLRACEVPSALVLSDLRDHTMPLRIADAMGTDVMHGHGLVAVWLDTAWWLVDPSHDAAFAEQKGYQRVEWDGHGDALIAATTQDGRRHAEYVGLHEVHLDLPFGQLLRTFAEAYAQADVNALAAAGVRVGDLDAESLVQLASDHRRSSSDDRS
ncbi:MAG: hypothetical protein JRH11_03865 [Deltaproteobacteria bacterium]|nr:hypothetical protein [Deltaproteobacteria bacterium]